MAKLQEQVLILKISKLVKDRHQETDTLVDSEFISNAESVLQELVGESCIVELVTDL